MEEIKMQKNDLIKVRKELVNIAVDISKLQGVACMTDLLFALARSKHVCVTKDYFNQVKKYFVGENNYEKEGRQVIKLIYNTVININLMLSVEYIEEEDLYRIIRLESYGLTYNCDETTPKLIVR